MQTLVGDVLSTRALTEVDRVQDNVPVSFGDTGLILYEAEEIPEAFTWTFLAVRSSRDVREAAGDVNEILSEPGFASFSTNLLGLIQAGSALANPAYAAGIEVAKFVAQARRAPAHEQRRPSTGRGHVKLYPAGTLSAGRPGKPRCA